jgi:hypothetical protein
MGEMWMKNYKIAVVFVLSFCFASWIGLPSCHGSTELVPWERLADFIIEISGWNKQGDIEGVQVDVPPKSLVVQRYVAESGNKSLEIHIFDSAEDMMVLMPIKMMMQDRKAPDAYTEKITLDGFPGVKIYDNSRKEAGLIVLILDRFVMQMFGHNFAEEEVSELEEIAKNHDIEGISNLVN